MRGPVSAALVLASVATVVACGSKGPPLPPLRPRPAKPETTMVSRVEGRPIAVRFTVPTANEDPSARLDLVEVRIYAVTLPPSASAPTYDDLLRPEYLVATIPVVDPTAPPPAQGTMAAARPGESVMWSDTGDITIPARLPQPGAAAVAQASRQSASPVRYYAVAGVSRHRRIGVPSEVIALPLTDTPMAPRQLSASFTATEVKLEWLGTEAGTAYRVYAVTDGNVADAPLHAEPLTVTSYVDPIATLGQERCYVVRAARVSGAASIESAAAGPACITPRDVFPPPAPASLTVVAGEGAMSLIWDAVDAPDLAGYLVLRAEAPGETLQPLFDAPITDTTYKDATTVAGTRYVYAVVALDTATPPNRSAESNRVEETGRAPLFSRKPRP